MALLRLSTAPLPELEMVPLAERLRSMAFFRIVLACLLIGGSVAWPSAVQGDLRTYASGTAGYLAISLVGYLLWRAWPGRGLFLFSSLLLLDGLFLVWATYLGGGVTSSAGLVVIAYIVAVALVASYRSALKLAMWLSLLFLTAFYLQGTGILSALGVDESGHRGAEYQHIVIFIAGLWLVAFVTSTYSALNERELRRRRFDLTALTNMAGELERDMRPSAIAQVFLDSTVQTFDYMRGVVLASSGGLGLTTLASHGSDGAPAAMAATGVLERCRGTREPVLLRRLGDDDGALAQLLPGAEHLVVVPMIAEGSVIGVLVVEHPRARVEQRALTILAQFAAHAALALRNAWLLQEVRTMADLDALTGVANRRSFDLRLELELKRAQRTNQPLSLMLLDLDHFKQVNDVHGHQAGDGVLRAVASALAANVRDELELVARYGGEEFAIVLPGCRAEDALLAAERLRATVAALHDLPVAVTASIGIATWPRNGLDGDAVVSAADGALYEAKRAGRDRVILSTALVGEPAAGVV